METAVRKAPTERVQDTRPLICFVCTGNTCRSPMAAALVCGADGPYRAVSAGLAACVGAPIAENAVTALTLAGVVATPQNPYPSHTAIQLDEELVRRADLVVGMTGGHLLTMLMQFPSYAEKLRAMPTAICDPFMGSTDVYRACLADIETGLRESGWLV